MSINPISAIVFSYLILGEIVTINQILGSVLIIVGIIFAQKEVVYAKK